MATEISPYVEALGSIQNLTPLSRQEREDRLEHYEQIKVAIAEKIEKWRRKTGRSPAHHSSTCLMILDLSLKQPFHLK